MLDEKDIPCDFFLTAWNKSSVPKACVDLKNRFVKVNAAWERLLGYSSQELRQMTWMDITLHSDIGGDAANVKAIINGTIDSYRMEKTYIHKNGSHIKIILYVLRFPLDPSESVALFNVQVHEQESHELSLEKLKNDYLERLEEMNDKVDEAIKDIQEKSNKVNVNVGDRMGSNNTKTVSTVTGADNKLLYAVLISIVGLIAYGIYAWAPGNQNVPIDPPTQIVQPVETE